jgi:hypothetical protein
MEISYEDVKWIEMIQDRIGWQAFVLTVIKIEIP